MADGSGSTWAGPIVADSDPHRELEECFVKARPLVHALGSRIDAGARRPALAHRLAHALGGGAEAGTAPVRPLPALGVLETIAVRDGRAQRMERHLARLAASVRQLYGVTLAPGLGDRVAIAADLGGVGAVRVVAGPDGRARVAFRRVVPRRAPVSLRAVTMPGGLGAHKWADRRLLDALARGGPTPLLVDSDGAVLEAAWGNVWIVEGDRLLTPPADGRILPGVARAALLGGHDHAGRSVEVAEVPLERLERADAVLVSSAVSGLVGASLLGAPAMRAPRLPLGLRQ